MYVDEYFTLQYRYPKGIYTLKTALWLHGLSLTVPFEPVMSFPYGTNTKLIKDAGVKPVILRANYNVGIVEVATPGGQNVKVYEKERTLTECLRPIYKMDVQIIAPAFKGYAKDNPQIKKIILHLDNDKAGRLTSEVLKIKLKNNYEIVDEPPPNGKDFNDFLLSTLGIEQKKRTYEKGVRCCVQILCERN